MNVNDNFENFCFPTIPIDQLKGEFSVSVMLMFCLAKYLRKFELETKATAMIPVIKALLKNTFEKK